MVKMSNNANHVKNLTDDKLEKLLEFHKAKEVEHREHRQAVEEELRERVNKFYLKGEKENDQNGLHG